MTEEQAAITIQLLNETLSYLEAMNQIMIGYQPYLMFISIVAALSGGIFIGSKWGK